MIKDDNDEPSPTDGPETSNDVPGPETQKNPGGLINFFKGFEFLTLHFYL